MTTLDPPILTANGGILVKTWHGYDIEILLMAFNARLVMTPHSSPFTYDYGWCYRNVPTAVLAGIGWDPDRFDEPPGWHKRPFIDVRQAPHRSPDAPVRCLHGVYPDGVCPSIGCVHGKADGS